MLAGDSDNDLTPNDIASEATEENKVRASSLQVNVHASRWHYVDVEIASLDLDTTCYRRRALPQGKPTSEGPAKHCSVNKLKLFERDLSNSATPVREWLIVLRFVLYLVRGLHASLRMADDNAGVGEGVWARHTGGMAANDIWSGAGRCLWPAPTMRCGRLLHAIASLRRDGEPSSGRAVVQGWRAANLLIDHALGTADEYGRIDKWQLTRRVSQSRSLSR